MESKEDSFFTLKQNECYFFSYANLNIDLLSSIFERKRESILYQNCVLRNFVRIFCDNKDGSSVASIYKDYFSCVYGIVVKITYNELDLLESYHKKYTLNKIRVEYTSCKIKSSNIIVNKDLKMTTENIKKKILTPFVFIYNEYINNNAVKPHEIYISEIRKMLNDRRKIENTCNIQIRYVCVKNIFNENDEYHTLEYIDSNTNEIKKYELNDNNNEKIVILGYENI